MPSHLTSYAQPSPEPARSSGVASMGRTGPSCPRRTPRAARPPGHAPPDPARGTQGRAGGHRRGGTHAGHLEGRRLLRPGQRPGAASTRPPARRASPSTRCTRPTAAASATSACAAWTARRSGTARSPRATRRTTASSCVLTDEDFGDAAADAPAARSTSLEFVPSDQVDPILFAKAYYLEPEKTAAKPYALLRQALETTDRVAVVKVALRQRETLAVLRVRDNVIMLQTMLWPDEVRAAGLRDAGRRRGGAPAGARDGVVAGGEPGRGLRPGRSSRTATRRRCGTLIEAKVDLGRDAQAPGAGRGRGRRRGRRPAHGPAAQRGEGARTSRRDRRGGCGGSRGVRHRRRRRSSG